MCGYCGLELGAEASASGEPKPKRVRPGLVGLLFAVMLFSVRTCNRNMRIQERENESARLAAASERFREALAPEPTAPAEVDPTLPEERPTKPTKPSRKRLTIAAVWRNPDGSWGKTLRKRLAVVDTDDLVAVDATVSNLSLADQESRSFPPIRLGGDSKESPRGGNRYLFTDMVRLGADGKSTEAFLDQRATTSVRSVALFAVRAGTRRVRIMSEDPYLDIVLPIAARGRAIDEPPLATVEVVGIMPLDGAPKGRTGCGVLHEITDGLSPTPLFEHMPLDTDGDSEVDIELAPECAIHLTADFKELVSPPPSRSAPLQRVLFVYGLPPGVNRRGCTDGSRERAFDLLKLDSAVLKKAAACLRRAE